MKPLLLCSDLDRTLIPNGAEPESARARQRFARLVQRDEVTLAYVTGRHRALIEQAIRDFVLPMPDFAIADVGSTIYQVAGHDWQRWPAWDAHISHDWGTTKPERLCALLGDFETLVLQEAEKQGRHKLSCYTPLTQDIHCMMAQIQTVLSAAGIRANLIWSVDEAMQQGLLDILPASANKRLAIGFLMQAKGFQREQVVFAGDSGNDLDVLQSDIPGVLVANADAVIKNQLLAERPGHLYIARGDYLGMNGNYSAGILEGLAHHRPDIDGWLRALD